MPYRFQSDSSMELALVVLPVVAVVILLFNACKMGKFGKKISEKLWAMSTGKQTAIVLIACLLAAELDDGDRAELIGRFHAWFRERTEQYGGENCEHIERGEPQNMLTICPGIIIDSYEKCVELLEERGLA